MSRLNSSGMILQDREPPDQRRFARFIASAFSVPPGQESIEGVLGVFRFNRNPWSRRGGEAELAAHSVQGLTRLGLNRQPRRRLFMAVRRPMDRAMLGQVLRGFDVPTPRFAEDREAGLINGGQQAESVKYRRQAAPFGTCRAFHEIRATRCTFTGIRPRLIRIRRPPARVSV